ncbi:hypothetical protein [Caviibacter abscessus]|uniref:hypothetical protein n=1 Tax=Caviibacter abscessus TaxID=1766719 RepID=UPI000830331D|nr:hypothetical protein [Caviibacter abscessus]
MNNKFYINKKQLLILLAMVFLVIVIESLQSLVITKDINIYIQKISRQDYIIANTINYFFNIIIYIFLAIYTFIIHKKIKIDKTYKLIWLILIASNILYKLFVYPLGKDLIFYYISIIMQILVAIYIVTLINQEKG